MTWIAVLSLLLLFAQNVFGAEGEWERTVAAAKREGKLSLYLYADGELEAAAPTGTSTWR